MLRLPTVFSVPVAFALVGFGMNAPGKAASIAYPFNATYNVSATSRYIGFGVSQVSLFSESTDASYGLTKVSGITYSQLDPVTGLFRFNTDPTTFGLQDVPFTRIVFSGSGNDQLIGTNNATGVIDFETLIATAQGTFTITGGEGRFKGAIGTLNLSEVDQLSLDPTVPIRGRAVVSGTFFVQTVPEPSPVISLVSTGAIGLGLLLRRYRRRERF